MICLSARPRAFAFVWATTLFWHAYSTRAGRPSPGRMAIYIQFPNRPAPGAISWLRSRCLVEGIGNRQKGRGNARMGSGPFQDSALSMGNRSLVRLHGKTRTGQRRRDSCVLCRMPGPTFKNPGRRQNLVRIRRTR